MFDCICGAHKWYRPFWCRYVAAHDNPMYHCTCPPTYMDRDPSFWSAAWCMWRGKS